MVYFISSNSYHIRMEEVNKIFKTLDNVEVVDFNDTNLSEIINIALMPSLFNDTKNLLVKNTNFSKEDKALETLEKLIEDEETNSTVVFLFNDKLDERKKVVKLLKEKNRYIYVKPLSYKDINLKLINRCKKKGYKLSDSNASYITLRSLSNYDIACIELDKVFLYYHVPCEIKLSDLENITSKSVDDNNFKLVDAIIAKDIEKSFELIKNLKLFKIDPLVITSLLAREYRFMLISKDLINKGYSTVTICKELNLVDWQANKLVNNSYSYSIRELEDKLLELLELDYKFKTSKIDKYLGLEMFVLNS